jgi:hypothetical protein
VQGNLMDTMRLIVGDEEVALAVRDDAGGALDVRLVEDVLHVRRPDRAGRARSHGLRTEALDSMVEKVDDGERAARERGEARGATHLATRPALEPSHHVPGRFQQPPLIELLGRAPAPCRAHSSVAHHLLHWQELEDEGEDVGRRGIRAVIEEHTHVRRIQLDSGAR